MPEILLKIIVCLAASLFAGVGTGFVGMSAAVAITPLLMGFLGTDHFDATTIALASDVLASAAAAIMYWRHKNVDFKNGALLMITVLVFTLGGTIAGYYIPNVVMGYGTVIGSFLIGIKLIFFPSYKGHSLIKPVKTKAQQIVVSVLFGALIGFVCGFVGAGGGMMLLLVLTSVLGFEMHKAVGTSVFIMTFSSLIGSTFHAVYKGIILSNDVSSIVVSDPITMGLCIVFTLLFSILASKLANKMSEKWLNLICGIMMVIIGVVVFVIHLVNGI